ncbi:MAG TPA: ABC transporter permease [Bryobacteraceae bacterium]|nr:ABC transporter permease [Bryobacteraceae bacterium]
MIRLFNWFRRRSLERGIDRELQYHFDRRVADLSASGIPEAEARRRVAVELGLARVREEIRDVWLTRWFRDFLYDLRFSARSFLRSPGFTAATLLSLALGIGATTAIYSLVDQVILHALPVRDPERLVLVDWNGDDLITYATGSINLMPYPLCRGLQQQTQLLDGVLCRAEIEVNLTAGGDPRHVAAEIVSGSYFSVLGVGTALGRVIEPEDDAAPAAGPVVVLSYDFWQAQFGGAADIVGRKVLIGNHPMTVVGVAAAGFRGVDVGAVPALWMPTSMYADANLDTGDEDLLTGHTRWLQILARLRPGVSAAQAQAGLQPWFKAWLEDSTRRAGFPRISADHRREYLATTLELTLAPQGHSPLRRSLFQPLWLLFAATGVLLGLACLNVAGLFLARGSARGREIGTRLALGASRGRIGRQLLADSLLLALAGGVLGAAVAPLAIRGLIAFLPQDLAANALSGALSFRLLTFAFFASLAAGLLSGLAPALRTGGDSLVRSTRERAGTGFGGVRLRKCIVTLQVAFALILLIGAVLFLRTLTSLLAKGPGFDTSGLLFFAIAPLENGYSNVDASRLVRRLDEQVRALPLASSSAAARFAFLTGGAWSNKVTMQTDHRTVSDGIINFNAVSPGFFSTLGVRVLAGRDFDQSDSHPPGEIGPRSAIVNQAFVKRYLAGRDPLGVLIARGGSSDVKPNCRIVGVVSDMSYRGLRDNSEQVFFPLFEHDDTGATFYIRVRGAPEQAIPSIRRLVRQDDPRLPILWFRTLDDQVNRSLYTERMLAALSGSFGALALLLSLIGLYGVMSFVVTRRTREIGIRLALGATRVSALRLVLRDAVTMIAAGVALALPCIAALGKLIQSQLFGVTATDPATLAGAAVVLAAGALAAAFIPAWRVSNVSPTDALRLE